MKTTRTIALLLLAVLCLGLFAGCSKNTAPEGQTAAGTQTAAGSGSTSTAAGEAGAVKLPISDDGAEFEIWVGYQAGLLTDLNDGDAYKELEKRTNIHINWDMTSSADAATSFGLVIASNDYPDSFQGSLNYFTKGFDFYLDEDIILDITDIANKYCPNYLYESEKEDVAKGVRTDTGRKPGFFGIKRTWQPSFLGPVVRADWLDSLGMARPETLSDLHDMLAAFKKNYAQCIAPYSPNSTGVDQFILQAWGITNTFYINPEGKVAYGPMQDVFLDYLTMMRDWYAEGILDPDFYTGSPFGRGFDTDYTLNGKTGYWLTNATSIDSLEATAAASGDNEFRLDVTHVPAMNKGDKRIATLSVWISPNRFQNNIGTINSSCEDIETLARWYDYLYTWDGCVLVSYGTEKYFFFDDAGVPHSNELIYANPDGLAPLTALYTYAMNGDMPSLYDWERENFVTMSEKSRAANAYWDENYVDSTALPTNLSISSEESARYSAIMSDVETYLNEIVVKFIIGSEPLSNFDNFRNTIASLNLDDAIQIRQGAVDRYNNR